MFVHVLSLTIVGLSVSIATGTLVGVPFDEWTLGSDVVNDLSYKRSVLYGYLIGIVPFFGVAMYALSQSTPASMLDAARLVLVVGLPVLWISWSVIAGLWAGWGALLKHRQHRGVLRFVGIAVSSALGVVAGLASAAAIEPVFKVIDYLHW